jgi:hypothetical protein
VAWSSKLARRIAPAGADRPLVTLRDAAEFLHANFADRRPGPVLEGAIEELIEAARTGKTADAERATFQVEMFLHEQNLLDRKAVQRHDAPPDLHARLAAMLARRNRHRT